MRLIQYLRAKVSDQVGELTKKFSNFPETYIQRSMEQVEFKTPRKNPRYLPRTLERKRFRFTTNRPWTASFYHQNTPHTHRKPVLLEPIETWSYFRGDRVQILVGRDKGKQGIVNQVIQERNWVFVEGLNCHFRVIGRDKKKDFPGIVAKSEAPLLVTTDVALVDPSDLQPTEFQWRYTEEGDRVRVSLRSGRVIPIPASAEETYDYKHPLQYIERPKDTKADMASAITFEPKLKTFEMDIMDEMDIKEDRIPKPTLWY